MNSISKALNILEQILAVHEQVGVSKLAELTGLNVTTTHRIANLLVKRGYLRQTQRGGKYWLGSKFLEFYAASKEILKIREVALPFLENLHKTVGESVNLAILDSDEVVYIEHIASHHSLRTFTQIGNRVPCYCTGVGKILLAYLPTEKRVVQAGQEVEVCQNLVKEEGIQTIIFCPGFTHKDIGNVVEAVGPKVGVFPARGDGPSVRLSRAVRRREGVPVHN
jgi:DNA-binding IclR family transcriptional regulator